MTPTKPTPQHPMTTNKEQTTELAAGWNYAGSVAVDTGTVLLIDPCFDKPEPAAAWNVATPYGKVPLSEHDLHTAVACRTGMGDGIYPAYVRQAPCPLGGGMVPAELRLVFFDPAQTAEAGTATQQIIKAHAQRLGVPAELLGELLLSYAARKLQEWEQQQEATDPGSVAYVGDAAPDWLAPDLKPLQPGVGF
jgi:hypothetical protein